MFIGDFAGDGFVLSAVDDDLTKIMVVFVDMSAVIQLSVGLLDLVIQLPEQYEGNTRGLVGKTCKRIVYHLFYMIDVILFQEAKNISWKTCFYKTMALLQKENKTYYKFYLGRLGFNVQWVFI